MLIYDCCGSPEYNSNRKKQPRIKEKRRRDFKVFGHTFHLTADTFGEEISLGMAAAPAAPAASPPSSKCSLREDLTCAICCDLFREPVMLSCMHHFCKACISRYWRGTLGPVTCPQCRKEFRSKQFQTNYLVAAMVDKVRSSSSDTYIRNLEKKLSDALQSHNSRKEDLLCTIRKDKDKMDIIKRVGTDLQGCVKSEFRALHQILQEEENHMLDQLRREETEELEKVQRHLEAAEQAMRELENNIQLLQQSNIALTEFPQLRPCVDVNVASDFDISAFSSKYLAPLQYITWRRMFKALKPAPAALTFDVETAHPSILVSRDKTVAVECDDMTPHPSNSKRFVQCVNILAAQAFQSGRHYWEVEVGSSPKWDVGVASETVDRRTRIKLSPENGYWTLRLRNGSEYWAGTQPWTRLQLGSPPQRIGVYLDCDERKVAFYNADDMNLLCLFSKGPRGKVFPFFSPCISENGQKPHPMKLLHGALSG